MAPLDELSELLRAAGPLLARPELRMEGPAIRARLRTPGHDGRREPGWLLTWPGEGGTGAPELRPWRLGDGPPDLEISSSAEDLVRHLRGELDLLCSRLPAVRFRKRAGSRAPEELIPVGERMLALLALACQTDERFAGSTAEELYLTQRSRREDGAYESMGNWSLPFGAGKLLYELVRDEGLGRTLEVGMAHGLSTLFVAQAHRDRGADGGAPGSHVAIDPWQARGFGRAGTENVRRAGLLDLVEVLEEPDWVALPRLAQEHPESFQLCFIDGLHLFDHVVLDLFYCDLLLAEGGYMVFDDASLKAVGAALDFFETSRGDSYERIDALSGDRIAVYRKTGPDDRVERHGVVFHRPFRGDGPAFPSFPPAARPRVLKRAFDLAVGVPLSMLAAGPALVLAGAIALEDARTGRGVRSPLERVQRVSRGRGFELLSFRTRDRAGEPTRVGGATERLRLTPLPQLWNLVRGDLSLVGPTPIRPDENVRRQLFETTGLRAGLVGPHDLADRSGDSYYHDWFRLGALSLLAHDLGVILRVLLGKLRAGAGAG